MEIQTLKSYTPNGYHQGAPETVLIYVILYWYFNLVTVKNL